MRKNVLFLSLIALLLCAFQHVSAREVVSFNDGWEFKKGPFSGNALQTVMKWDGKWEQVTLPHTWNAQDMQRKAASFYQGEGYYRKRFTFPESMKGKRVYLRFEGVGSCAEVYINGCLAGTH